LVSIVLIATIPIIASQAQTGFMAIRGLLFYPIFCIFIGLGIHTAIAVAEKGRYKNLFVGVLLIVYTILILNFINIYAFQFSIYSSESYSFSSRILSKYALFGSNENKKIVVYTTSPKERFIYYLFFSSLYENRLAGEIQNKFIRKEYSWKTVQFSYCDNDSTPQENTIYIIESGGCDKMKSLLTGPKKTIPILADGGSVYSIVGDSICDLYALSRYPNNLLFSDLSVENLTKERFCKAFITEIK